MRKKLFIGIAAGVAALGGAVALIAHKKKKAAMEKPFIGIDSDDEDFWEDDDDFDDFDDDFEDDFDDEEIVDPELRDSKAILDSVKTLMDVVNHIVDRKRVEYYGA